MNFDIISVDERTPRRDGSGRSRNVLAWNRTDKRWMIGYVEYSYLDGLEWFDASTTLRIEDVTHWCAMPGPVDDYPDP